MNNKKASLFLVLAGILVWAVVMWPLPRHFADAVPHTDRVRQGELRVTATVPGDHLQLLYHFWLARDTFAGKTPLFANIYEFDNGGENPKRLFSTYYLPFSAVYAMVSPMFGHAAGWNAAGLFSVLLGLFGAFALARRLSGSALSALFVAIAFSAFPYRWMALISGSPTGFAMGLVPWIAYGIDRLVRDCSTRGAAIAGFAILMAFCSDLHVFYFSALATPLFGLFSFLLSGGAAIKSIRGMAVAALPFAFFAALAAVLSKLASAGLDESAMSGGRSMGELRLFSPALPGLFTRQFLDGATNSIYLGFASALFFAVALAYLASSARSRPWRFASALLLSAAVIASFLLAAGAYGPMEALPIRIARSVIPKYSMIRQTAKVFCLLPTIFTAIAALAMQCRTDDANPVRHANGHACSLAHRCAKPVLLAIGCAMLAEQCSWFSATVSSVDADIPAYRAAASNATVCGLKAPKALALPIWPGDSHFSSLYELGIMSSRLRLLNGYSPSPPASYFQSVFKPLESLNQGAMSFAQYKMLQDDGVEYIFFHEDAFPDKVSPFPAGVSLATLRKNPALEPIISARRVTAFRLRKGLSEADFAAAVSAEAGVHHTILDYPPALIWRSRQISRSLETASEPGRINLALRAPVVLQPQMRYLLFSGDAGWRQITLDGPMGGEYALPEGMEKPEMAMLAAGADIGEREEIVPARLFHVGTSLADGQVLFDSAPSAADAAETVMEGPFTPIPPGDWTLTAEAEGASAASAILQIITGTRGGETQILAERLFKEAHAPSSGVVQEGSRSFASIDFTIPEGGAPFALRIASHRNLPMRVVHLSLAAR